MLGHVGESLGKGYFGPDAKASGRKDLGRVGRPGIPPPGSHWGQLAAGQVAAHGHGLAGQEGPELVGKGGKELFRGGALGHEGRQVPERGLRLGQAPELATALVQ